MPLLVIAGELWCMNQGAHPTTVTQRELLAAQAVEKFSVIYET
jgi:hypothetical protein